MRSSALTTLLCNAGLPVSGYDFERHSRDEHDAMVRRVFDNAGTVVTENPAVVLVEIESQQVIYLITQPGHFAHPSIIRRSLFIREGVKGVQVSGFTAASSEIMSTWVSQFRLQDELMSQSLKK